MESQESDRLFSEYQKIRHQAYQLAGGLTDLSQRASVYFHLYQVSQGRNIFPLIAAHGALWASGYFATGMKIGKLLSWQYGLTPKRRQKKIDSMVDFANAFRDINRQVCAEAYTLYHFTRFYGDTVVARQLVPERLLLLLNSCHDSIKNNTEFSMADRFQLFLQFFLWEQETIVAPAVEKAIPNFDWPLVKYLAMKPRITFSYLGFWKGLKFVDFSSKNERIIMGTRAYLMAENIGFKKVEQALDEYGVMPSDFLYNAERYFNSIKTCELVS
jgi:hypothetical protein